MPRNTFKVVSLDETAKHEKNFNKGYHEKYIGKEGTVVFHPVKIDNPFYSFVCLRFADDDIDWFHLLDVDPCYKDILEREGLI